MTNGSGNAAGQDRPAERIIEMETERLRDFKDHPFSIREDDEMKDLMDSIASYGILSPLIVRPMQEGFYEIISGHRRKYAAQLLGYRKVPVIIRVMTDDEAVIGMVDANLHREHIVPSEKAFAIRMKYDAIKRNNGRKRKSGQEAPRPKGVRSIHILGEQTGDSPKQIQRYLKITELVPEMLDMLDHKQISFNPAYEIAFLEESQQKKVLEAMQFIHSAPSLSQAQRIRQMGEEHTLTVPKVREILSEVKKGEINRVTFKNEQLYQFFPRDYPAKKMKQDILDILARWNELKKDAEPKEEAAERKEEAKESKESKAAKEPGAGLQKDAKVSNKTIVSKDAKKDAKKGPVPASGRHVQEREGQEDV